MQEIKYEMKVILGKGCFMGELVMRATLSPFLGALNQESVLFTLVSVFRWLNMWQ